MATGLKHVLENLQQAGGGLSDRQLLARFLGARDEAAFAALVRRHGAMVLGLCRRVLHDFHEAEDAFQATFLVLAVKAPSLVVNESLGCWLYGVAYRTALQASVLSARRRARERPMKDLPHPEVAPAEARDWLPLLDRELSLLPEKYRAAIVVCDLEGRTRREAARLLGIAEGTLSSRLARGRTLLARRLAGRGVALSGGLAVVMAQGAASASVPAALVSSTARAAVLVAAGQLAGATPAVLLMQGVMKAMLLKTLRLVVGAVMVLVALGAVGFGYVAGGGSGSAPVSPLDREADSHGDPLPAGALARLGTTRLRHAADVTFVGFGPGGKTLLTAGQDGTIRLWDLAGHKEIRRFAPPTPIPGKPPEGKKQAPQHLSRTPSMAGGGGREDFRVALTADGKTLAAARGNVIQLWDVETGKELRRLKGPAGGLAGLLFSPAGRTLAGRAFNRDLILWATGSGKELHHIKAPQGPRQHAYAEVVLGFGGGAGATAATMAFTADGKALAAAATDYEQQKVVRSIKFWDVASGKERRRIRPPKGAGVGAVALAPDGKLLAYISDYITRLCEADTGREVRQLRTGGSAVGLAFVGDSRTLAARGNNERLRLWDTQTGKELRDLSEAELPRQAGGGLVLIGDDFVLPEVQTLAISPDGKRIAAAAGRTVRLWDAATGKELPLLNGHWRAPTAIRVSPDGKTVVSWGSDRVVRRWEAATGKPLGAFPAPPRTKLAAFSPDGRIVALANADNTIRLHDTSTGKEVRRLKGQLGGIAALAFAPGGKVLASRGLGDKSIRLWDAARGVELRQLTVKRKERPNHGSDIDLSTVISARTSSGTGPGLAFSPDGRMVVVPQEASSEPGKMLVLLDTATGKELRKIASPRPIASFVLSPDGRSLAAENTDRTITLWELASGKEQGRLGKAVAPGPRRAAGPVDLVVAIDFNGETSAPGGPVGVSFSPDGRALAVRGADGSVHVWDLNAGKEISPFKGQGGRVETVSFAPGGMILASGASDTTILLWDAAGLFKKLSKPQRMQLSATEVEALWGKLAGTDATAARQGILKLAAAPRQAVPFLGQRLKPAGRVDPRKISGWIADLDSEKFAVRRSVSANLLKAGEQALPAIRKALASGPQLETRKRLEELVDRLTRGTLTTEQLQVVRAVEALERMGTPEAAKLLRTLADGAPGALPTREARAALSRLAAH